MGYYNLDLVNYTTSPGLAWAALLLMPKLEVELIHDVNMLHMVETNKTGWIMSCRLKDTCQGKTTNAYHNSDSAQPSLIF